MSRVRFEVAMAKIYDLAQKLGYNLTPYSLPEVYVPLTYEMLQEIEALREKLKGKS